MKHIIILLLTLLSFARQETSRTIIALIDTTYRSETCYNSFIKLNEAAGITIRFLHPSTKTSQDLCGCNGVFVALDPHFLTNLESEYAQLTIKPLQQFFKKTDNFFGILFPSLINKNFQILTKFLKIFNIDKSITSDIQQFINYQNQFKPLYTTQYYTKTDKTLPPLQFTHAQRLPFKKLPSYLSNNFPIALMIKNDQWNLFISTLSNMTFADLEEDNKRNPIEPYKRKELLNATLSSLKTVFKEINKNNKNEKTIFKKNVLNKLVNKKTKTLNYQTYKKQSGLFKWVSNGISCGWLSIDYDPKMIEKNLNYIAQTKFDMLWLELPLKLYKKSEEFNKKINFFTKKLEEAYQNKNQLLPKIFIDFDFGATLHWCHQSTHPIDIYGNEYKKVPAPLEYKEFWRPCILKVLKNVCNKWKNEIGNGIPIDGIIFNFYFWNSKEMPFYTNLIDFSDSAWNAYQKYHPAINISSTERINYILKNNKLTEYLFILEKEASELAKLITDDIHQILPCAMIGAYTQTPLDTWFYRAIMQNLGSKQNPLLWFTNNLNYYGHRNWIDSHHIHALHLTNIYLDHFNNRQDIHLINKLAQSHDGLWYSRASRIGEKYQQNKWWSPEATTCNPKKLINLINKQAQKK
ncbi:TPA: hypothetical protein DIC20_03125 [Candidatus Dependentiae bacterium]|nr:MAG: hypothetical protein US03_C0001G0015 [candidate division TM6 bacterium GW2011_GWF2_36_131]KKQ03849.1 MAG: hypothetical protein US13_C0001G0189 [candidate division TM6 bacterium GW2011_GWE2_36_25]HBR70617.1 hypothetical protein [Candidatus Dependentiae bacterium]HCU00668.1 hypothetical protein [Candidatus Dependentiae bacterium]